MRLDEDRKLADIDPACKVRGPERDIRAGRRSSKSRVIIRTRVDARISGLRHIGLFAVLSWFGIEIAGVGCRNFGNRGIQSRQMMHGGGHGTLCVAPLDCAGDVMMVL